MHSRLLEQALREFAEDASAAMQRDLAAGAEIPFELASSGGARRRGGTRLGGRSAAGGLNVYRPLTAEFIAQRWLSLRALPSHAPAVRALDGLDGLERYLAARGLSGAAAASTLMALPGLRGQAGGAERALVAFTEDVFAEQSDLRLHEGRLCEALERLEIAAAGTGESIQLLATLHGMAIASEELPLAPGLTIARTTALSGLPEQAVWPVYAGDRADGEGSRQSDRAEQGAADHLLVLLTQEIEDRGVSEAIADGVQLMRELLRALRLFGDGRITLGAIGWARCGNERFEPVALGFAGRPRRGLLLTAEQEDELRAFCSLVSRRAARGGALAWALDRFEMGCERRGDRAALSDYLLALQALLEPQRSAPGLLAARLAALCAPPEARKQTADRVLEAFELERRVIESGSRGSAAEVELAREIEGHLKAILSDVLCGHLRAELPSLADEMLLSGEGCSAQMEMMESPRARKTQQPQRRARRSARRIAVPAAVEDEQRPGSAEEPLDPLQELAQGILA